MKQDLSAFVERALLVPFEPHGRTMDGWDCWGLVVVAYQEILGIELPSYGPRYEADDVHRGSESLGDLIREVAAERWERVTSPEPMDVVVYLSRGRPVHVGLVLDDRLAIQVRERGTYVAPYRSRIRSGPLDGIYRRVR